MNADPAFTPSDLEEIRAHGLAVDDAEHQLRQLVNPPPYTRLDRPCRVGDGIRQIGDEEASALVTEADEAARRGRITKFVPASGAATRMFQTLIAVHGEPAAPTLDALSERARGGDEAAADTVRLCGEIHRFPFHTALDDVLRTRGAGLRETLHAGRVADILSALLASDGLAYASRPKGQLLFHAYEDEARTPFEEHLVEAAAYAKDAHGRCRVHATVSPEHRAGFESLVASRGPGLSARLDAGFEVSYSHQAAATDTIATDLSGRPFRDSDGRLLFRPGGHGALIQNLEAIGGDILLVKNIDNVVPDRTKPLVCEWKKILTGVLVGLERRVHELLERLDGGGDDRAIDPALDLLASELSRPDERPPSARGEAARRFLVDRLDRPLRVAGVVPNAGEPGGGPFWVTDADGRRSVQIVETSQIDPEDPVQQGLLAQATHFNPVDLACAMRRRDGSPHRLTRFVDPETVFVSRKSVHGREIRALERPGLWNGAMQGWNTVFVAVPLETFAPVKTVFDLLRSEHQPDRR